MSSMSQTMTYITVAQVALDKWRLHHGWLVTWSVYGWSVTYIVFMAGLAEFPRETDTPVHPTSNDTTFHAPDFLILITE